MLMGFIRGLFEATSGIECAADSSSDLQAVEAALSGMPRDQARYLAGVALLLARIAHVDLEVLPEERERLKQALRRQSQLDLQQIEIVAALAVERALLHSVEEHIVLRELNALATYEQKRDIVRALFHVAAADDVSERESEEIGLIAKGFLIARSEFLSIRSEFRDQLRVLKNIGE